MEVSCPRFSTLIEDKSRKLAVTGTQKVAGDERARGRTVQADRQARLGWTVSASLSNLGLPHRVPRCFNVLELIELPQHPVPPPHLPRSTGSPATEPNRVHW